MYARASFSFLFILSISVVFAFGQDSTLTDSLVLDSLRRDSMLIAMADTSAKTITQLQVERTYRTDPEDVKRVLRGPQELDENDIYDQEPFFSLASPFHTTRTFLYYLQDDSYQPELAALTLNARELDEKEAEKRAVWFKQYLDGAGHFIYLRSIPYDSNHVDSTGKHIYQLLPDVKSVYLYKKGDYWLFSKETVDAVPGLFRGVYPIGTVRGLPNWAKAKIGAFQLWQIFGIIVFILLAIVLHKVLTKLIGLLLHLIGNRLSDKDVAQKIYNSVSRPVSLFILTWVIIWLAPMLQLPPWWAKYELMALRIALSIFGILFFYRLVDLLSAFAMKLADKTESTLDDQLVPLARKILKGIVLILGLLVVLQNMDVNITTLLAGLSIGGLALALAAQDTVKNFFGSVMIFIDRPFQVGDWIITSMGEGTVEEVGVRSTRIRTFANSQIYIPNGMLADHAVNNMGLRKYRRFMTTVGLTYDTTPDQMEAFVQGLREIVKEHPTTWKDNYEIHFTEMGGSSLNILFYVFFEVPTWTKELEGKQQLLLAIMSLAEKLEVEFAFPTQTLHVDSFPGQEKSGTSLPAGKQENERRIKEFVAGWKQQFAKGREEK